MEGIIAIWQRDIIKFFRDRARLLGSLAMPVMFLVFFGTGMSGALHSMLGSAEATGPLAEFDFVQFMFPGIIGMTVFSTAIFSALSVVHDKEFGYLKEILVSPVSRSSVAIGKILGGTTIAVLQGLLLMIFVPLIGVNITMPILLRLVPAMFLMGFSISSIGLLLASRVKTAQGFQIVVQTLVFPMLFLAGIFFPVREVPFWMNVLIKINPLTYSVNMLKRIILEDQRMEPLMREAMGLDFHLIGYRLTLMDEVMIVSVISLVFVALATISFNRSEAK